MVETPILQGKIYVFRIFVFIILVLCFLEIGGLLVVGQWLGTLPVLALLSAGIFFGVRLIRQSGGALFGLGRQSKFNPQALSSALAGGLLKAVAGLLLILPGFLSDLCGLVLLLPAVGRFLATKLKPIDTTRNYRPQNGPVIEGEIISAADNDNSQPRQFPDGR